MTEIGELRRSSVAFLSGPGALVDFRGEGAPVSAVIAGIEEWDARFPPAGLANQQSVYEERLQRLLGVNGFRLPPVRDPTPVRDPNRQEDRRALPAVRFPKFLQCPNCSRIGRTGLWASDPGRPGLWCVCSGATAQRRTPVVPVRFVVSCEAGHLDEFPWHQWVGHREGCGNREGFLTLRSEGPGLAGLLLSCPACRARRSMEGIFAAESLRHLGPCRGFRPWLGDREQCERPRIVVQRGASNLYFPDVASALSIPPWSDRLQEALGQYWASFAALPDPGRVRDRLEFLLPNLRSAVESLGIGEAELARELEERVRRYGEIGSEDLRGEEYRQLSGPDYRSPSDRKFETRNEAIPARLQPHVSKLVRVTRLTEVRALRGFRRVTPGGALSPISREGREWLPAIEVRGEGIFIELDRERVLSWERQQAVEARLRQLRAKASAARLSLSRASSEAGLEASARFLLVHSLAHCLMRQLTLDCGYSSSALRERLYVSEGSGGMAGLLIYTASTDDDGTMGGLQRQADPVRMGRTFELGVRAMEWCSSDPLCVEGLLTENAASLAACHSCMLAPETACEEHNLLLDRAMLVGTPDDPSVGFLSGLLRP